jgi:hypothetical protein
MRGPECKRARGDEQWRFVGDEPQGIVEGDGMRRCVCYSTWNTIDREFEAVPEVRVGKRGAATAQVIVCHLVSRIKNLVRPGSDSLGLDVEPVARGFVAPVDSEQILEPHEAQPISPARRTAPSVSGISRTASVGILDGICTSHIERLLLSSNCNRFRQLTRLVDSLSNAVENLEAAVAVTYDNHTFVLGHSAHKVTPAMARGSCRNRSASGTFSTSQRETGSPA